MKDTWDTRMAKLRLSADSFVRQQEAHAKVRRGQRFASPAGSSPGPRAKGELPSVLRFSWPGVAAGLVPWGVTEGKQGAAELLHGFLVPRRRAGFPPKLCRSFFFSWIT